MRDKPRKVVTRNRVRCRKCDTIAESVHRHHFVNCKCGAVATDGGLDYIRRIGNPEDMEYLDEYE